MINNSTYWKNDILKNVKCLQKRLGQERWSDASFARVEQVVILGFYSIRKLAESKVLSESAVNQSIQLTGYLWKGKRVTRLNSLRIDKLYDLDNGLSLNKDLLFVCNQIVHSYIFMTPLDENKNLSGVIFNSDRERHTALYFIEISQIIALFELIGNDDPNHTTMVFNKSKKDFDVTSPTRI